MPFTLKSTADHAEYRASIGVLKCFHEPIRVEGAAVECNVCKRTFKTQQCFDNHKNAIYTKNRSVCDILKYCTGCKCIYSKLNRKGNHDCGEKYCPTCGNYKPAGHLCYMVRDERKTDPKKTKFLYMFFYFVFDFDTPVPNRYEHYLHKPNFCVLQLFKR